MNKLRTKLFLNLFLTLPFFILYSPMAMPGESYRESVVQKAVQKLQQKLSHAARNVKIEIENKKYISSVSVAPCDTGLSIKDLFPNTVYGRGGVKISCKSPSWGFYLPVTVSADIPVVVAKTYILKGEVFTENNIEETFLPHTAYRKGMVESIHSILGKEARRSINITGYVSYKMARPPVIVRKNSVVDIIYKSNGLSLKTLGVSTEDGRLGDSIKVLNKASNKPVWGKVLKENEIVVE